MGAGQSQEELLYQEVVQNNHDAVKKLRRNGASLEYVDKEGRTPLVLACVRGELLDMVSTLLNLGANINAYRPGTHRGTPLHHAAKRGLEKTVTLLLSRGANPMVINDSGLTPLQMARSRGHVSVVRILEEHLCLFSGTLREISGFGILGTIAPNLVTKRIWAVVLPVEASARRAPTYELAVYQSIKVPQPRTIISLAKAELEEPKFNTPDPVLYIFDKSNKTKYKFLSEREGDKVQLEKLFKACKGIRLGVASASSQSAPSQNAPVSRPEGGGTTFIIEPVFQTGSTNAPNESSNDHKGWNPEEGGFKGWLPSSSGNKAAKKHDKAKKHGNVASHGGWEGGPITFTGLGTAGEAGPSTVQNGQGKKQATEASLVQPSAPPLPEHSFDYPSITTGAGNGNATGSNTATDGDGDGDATAANMATDEKPGNTCVICWDAPAEGACVPCGHLAGCMDCLSEVKAKNWGCPVCREQIQQVVKVYAV